MPKEVDGCKQVTYCKVCDRAAPWPQACHQVIMKHYKNVSSRGLRSAFHDPLPVHAHTHTVGYILPVLASKWANLDLLICLGGKDGFWPVHLRVITQFSMAACFWTINLLYLLQTLLFHRPDDVIGPVDDHSDKISWFHFIVSTDLNKKCATASQPTSTKLKYPDASTDFWFW